MSLYYRNLKKIGIFMILVAAGNLIYELLIRQYLTDLGSPFVSYVPLPWGIWTKNLLGVAAGLITLLIYLKKRHNTIGTMILAVLCVAEAIVIILSMTGSVGKRTNGIFDFTMLTMILLTYTMSQTDRDLKQWNSIGLREPSSLDLRLLKNEDFFDSIQVGPKMAINVVYASVINRYISSMRNLTPLQINLFCSEPVSGTMQDMMREVLVMHYETEENRIAKDLEKRYRRIMLLISVSVIVIGIIRQTSLFSSEMIVLDVITNFTAFGLWQIGYTYYERTEGYEKLLLIHIAKNARLCFIER